MDESNSRRIILLGKTGVGKSSLANTIFGEAKFQTSHHNDLKTNCSRAETKIVNGRSITLIDTPGFFDTERSEKDFKPEALRCITECAPGPHAFLIVLKVEKFTEQEQAVITRMCEFFSEDALTYAAVIFTHGDQLPEGKIIEDYVNQSKGLSDLMKRCGGRSHVIDNKYWKNYQQDDYRSNQFQLTELLKTVDKLVIENNGAHYTNKMLQDMETSIQKEEEHVRKSSANMSEEEIRKQARSNVLKKQEDNAPLTWIRGLVGLAVIGALLASVTAVLIKSTSVKVLTEAPIEVIQIPTLPFAEPTSAIVEVVVCEVFTEQVKEIQNPLDIVWNTLSTLYERTYNPWNPFE